MTAKIKPPAHPARPAPRSGRTPAPQAPGLPPTTSRWQRTVRYGWDKGGARGGRK